MMFIADKWKDYEIMYAGCGMKYERWGDVVLLRPDPQAVWPVMKEGRVCDWKDIERPDAVYERSSSGGGMWHNNRKIPNSWNITYSCCGTDLKFGIEPMSFKHTGLFPEQAANWDFMAGLIRASGREDVKVLNLFGYTGAATCALASAGAAEVVHCDASKGMNAKAKHNIELSGLTDSYVRFITEDCRKFVERELRRGRKYDGIVMDPPSYGRGPSGELWKLEDSFYELAELAGRLLSDDPLFFVASSYATAITCEASAQIIKLAMPEGKVSAGELGLPVTKMRINLPCGASARWTAS